jgi:hypothetical protein
VARTQPNGVTHWEGPGLDAWRPWSPRELAAKLAGVAVPWCVVGGWAIDLWLGRQTRPHEDIEVAIPRTHFAELRDHLAAFELYVVGQGEVRELPPGQLPPADKHQNWVLDGAAASWRVDVMLDPGDSQTWVFRRDERICAPRSRMVAMRGGIPYLQPEGVLLFKAKGLRDKDEADFRACLPVLDPERRTWLAQALELVHPGHPWIERLRTSGGVPA